MRHVNALLRVSRPISWPNTAYPFAATYLVLSGGQFDGLFWLATLFFLIPYNLLMYGINDIFDYESDMKNPRKGGIEGAREQKAFHPVIAVTAVVSCVPFVAGMAVLGTTFATFVLAAALFFVVAYSIKGLRFKEIPLLDSFTSSIHFVGPMFYAIALLGFEPAYLPYLVAFLLWGMASHAFGAVQDIIPDRSAGIHSIATALGAQWTMRMVVTLYTAAAVIVILQGWPAIVVGFALLLYTAVSLPFVSVSDQRSESVNTGWRYFIWLNLITGFIITVTLLLQFGLTG